MITRHLTSFYALCIAFALCLDAKADPVVTFVEEFTPQFSLQVEAHVLQQLQQSSKALDVFKYSEVNKSVLVNHEDQEAIQKAANVIAKRFLTAADLLAQIRILGIQIDSTSKAFSTKMLRTGKKIREARIKELFRSLVNNLITMDDECVASLEACKSELCLSYTSAALNNLIATGKALNKSSSKILKKESVLLEAALEETYFLWKSRSSQDDKLLIFIGELITLAKGQQSARKTLSTLLNDKSLKLIKSSQAKIEKSAFCNENVFAAELVESKIKEVVGGPYVRPKKNNFRYTYTLACESLNDWVTLAGFRWAYNKNGAPTSQCLCLEDQKYYTFDSLNIGPGLSVFGLKGQIKILSPIPIKLKGHWGGLNIGVGFGVGGSASVLFGKKGSVALIGTGGGGIGAHVAYSSLWLKPA